MRSRLSRLIAVIAVLLITGALFSFSQLKHHRTASKSKHGSRDMITITGGNLAPGDATVLLTNLNTGDQYFYLIPHTWGVFGSVTNGTYNAYFSTGDPNTNEGFSCGWDAHGDTATVYNVPIENCDDIYVEEASLTRNAKK